jgi:hypothetical protein
VLVGVVIGFPCDSKGLCGKTTPTYSQNLNLRVFSVDPVFSVKLSIHSNGVEMLNFGVFRGVVSALGDFFLSGGCFCGLQVGQLPTGFGGFSMVLYERQGFSSF